MEKEYDNQDFTESTLSEILEKKKGVKRKSIKIDFDWDWKFFAITPCFNINFHSKTFEFEWLFFAMYIDKYNY